jgi:uncharacterized protein
MKILRRYKRAGLLFAVILTVHCGNRVIGPRLPAALRPLDHGQVRLEGEIGRRIDITMRNNVMKLDVDGVFLRHFRNKSAEPAVRDGFVGIGMLLDALVGFSRYSRDAEMIRLKNHVAGELVKTQEADGYIGIFTPGKRMKGWDTHEGAYIILALTDDYRFFGNEQSLRAARKYADLLIARRASLITGLEDAFLALTRETGDKKYLDACVERFGLAEFRRGNSRHVYGYLERCLMQVLLNQLQPDARLLYKPHVAVEFLVNLDGLDIIGASGMWEHMNTTQAGNDCNGETCATAYIIRLMDGLLQAEVNSFYGDIMERSLYNALFAAQSPDGRKLRYFTDYESAREYYPDDYFCCPGNFRRIISDLPRMIYYQRKDGIIVNLYCRSKADIRLGDTPVAIEQITDYPSSGLVRILVNPETDRRFDLALRIPFWCKNASASVNGESVRDTLVPGAFHVVSRMWKKGDEVRLNMPMEWRIIRGKNQQYRKAALMRGPVVYTMNDTDNDFLTESAGWTVDVSSIGMPVPDSSFRPGGLRCFANAVTGNGRASRKLTFTEFIDPAGVKTFFIPSGDENRIMDDEFVTRQY